MNFLPEKSNGKTKPSSAAKRTNAVDVLTEMCFLNGHLRTKTKITAQRMRNFSCVAETKNSSKTMNADVRRNADERKVMI